MIVKYDLHKDQCILLPRPQSNDPRLIQYIYHYSHSSKLFVEVYKVRVGYCTRSEFSFRRHLSNIPVAQYFKHSDLPVISIHKVSLILQLDFLLCIGHTEWINTKTATNNGSTLNAQNCLCSKSDLHVFSICKTVCFILIVPYSDLHVVSIHTG